MNTILGKKLEMSQIFDEKGNVQPVTKVLAGPCLVVGKKTQGKDGYEAVVIGYQKAKRPKKPVAGLAKNLPWIPKFLTEEKLGDALCKVGGEFGVEIFEVGDTVSVTGTSKGKGFTGVVKRWGFAGGPATHGQSDRLRAPGSIGATTTPGRVFRGKKMAGRAGGKRVTVRNLRVVSVDKEKNLLTVSGAVPGARNGLLIIRKIAVQENVKAEKRD